MKKNGKRLGCLICFVDLAFVKSCISEQKTLFCAARTDMCSQKSVKAKSGSSVAAGLVRII
jgi:hypothetical protein